VDKQFHKSFPNEFTYRVSQPLQKIHANVCGSIQPCLFGENLHYLLFIDDYSRKTWVYFLKKSLMYLIILKNLKH
jgi:hypothetical protein